MKSLAQTLFIPKEIDTNEPRVGGSAETVKKLIGLGFTVIVETGAGTASRIPDREFEAAGATIGKAADVKGADVVLKVRRPASAELKSYKKAPLSSPCSTLTAMMRPSRNWPMPV